MRRQIARLLVVALVATTAGCGFVTGDEPLQFSASPAEVSDAAQSETGYEETEVTSQVVTREFTVAGQTREVNVTNRLAQYEREVELGPLGTVRAGVFATFASPEVSVGPETFNPIADMSERELLAQFESQYEGLSVGDRVGNETRTVLGEETGVKKFEGTAEISGAEVDVYVHATKVKHEGDHVVALAVYPQRLSGEEENVYVMLDGLEHDGE